MLQTRRGDDLVLSALARVDFSDVLTADVADARALGLAPYGASAEVSGEGADAVVDGLAREGLFVTASASGFLVRAKDPLELGRLLKERSLGSRARITIS